MRRAPSCRTAPHQARSARSARSGKPAASCRRGSAGSPKSRPASTAPTRRATRAAFRSRRNRAWSAAFRTGRSACPAPHIPLGQRNSRSAGRVSGLCTEPAPNRYCRLVPPTMKVATIRSPCRVGDAASSMRNSDHAPCRSSTEGSIAGVSSAGGGCAECQPRGLRLRLRAGIRTDGDRGAIGAGARPGHGDRRVRSGLALDHRAVDVELDRRAVAGRWRRHGEGDRRHVAAGREERVANLRGALEFAQRRRRERARERVVLPPGPFALRGVDQRGEILGEEPVEHAAGAEQPAEIRERNFLRAAARERIAVRHDLLAGAGDLIAQRARQLRVRGAGKIAFERAGRLQHQVGERRAAAGSHWPAGSRPASAAPHWRAPPATDWSRAGSGSDGSR